MAKLSYMDHCTGDTSEPLRMLSCRGLLTTFSLDTREQDVLSTYPEQNTVLKVEKWSGSVPEWTIFAGKGS